MMMNILIWTAVGIVAFLALCGLVCFCRCRRKDRNCK